MNAMGKTACHGPRGSAGSRITARLASRLGTRGLDSIGLKVGGDLGGDDLGELGGDFRSAMFRAIFVSANDTSCIASVINACMVNFW